MSFYGGGIRGLQQCLNVGEDAIYLTRSSLGPAYTQDAWQRARRSHQQTEARDTREQPNLSRSSSITSRSMLSGRGTLPKNFGAGSIRFGGGGGLDGSTAEPKEYFLPQLPSSILEQRTTPSLRCCSIEDSAPVGSECGQETPHSGMGSGAPASSSTRMRALVRAFRPGSQLNDAVRQSASAATSSRVRAENNFMKGSRLLAGEPPSASVHDALSTTAATPTPGQDASHRSSPPPGIRLFQHGDSGTTDPPELLWMRQNNYKELQAEQAVLAKAQLETMPEYQKKLDALEEHHLSMRRDFARLLYPRFYA